MLRSVLLILACVLVTVYCACTDGQDNVCGIGDDSNGALNIELNNMVGWTYDSNNVATCKGSEAALTMPGVIKLVQGTVTVRAASSLAQNGIALLTAKKNSMLIGTVCDNGKSKNALVPDSDCQMDINQLFEPAFIALLDTPGTYTLEDIEQAENLTSPYLSVPPFNSGGLSGIISGEWQMSFNVQCNGQSVMKFHLPSNTKWIDIID
ncbi:hypothetical protein WR25_21078 [Diploscapter pachys]|uniref:Uncharacterized protein n=1 Tax=Diploscapter pachys TaxID=2018661 RepID=A0A2A2KFI3_9BILA|nr:hypothetical protein WR25_21078 [Diploscapter pachys]